MFKTNQQLQLIISKPLPISKEADHNLPTARHLRYKQLDGLRALAVLAVMAAHWLPEWPFQKKIALGFWGVNLFFVLSGFLITEILMKKLAANESRKSILKSFYINRTLRIFPIYYLVIVVATIFNLDDSRALLSYTFSYTLNVYNAQTGDEGYYLAHLWSLCVEEQFYLVWPFLLLLIKPLHHKKLIIAMLATAVIYRFAYCFFQNPHFHFYDYRMLPSCLDALGLGALLAYMKLYQKQALLNTLRLTYIPIAAFAIFLLANFTPLNQNILFSESFMRLCVSICCFFVIGKAVFEYKNWFGKFLSLKPVQYLGKISYGLYLYHLIISRFIVQWINGELVTNFPGFLPHKLIYNLFLVDIPIEFILTVTLATLSYRFFETPFLVLKERIKLRRQVKYQF